MQPLAPEALLSNLQWRYATKKFDPSKKIPPHLWSALEQSLQLAPSSYGLSPWRFVVVTDPAVRARLREVAWNQPQVTDASHFVVLARKSTMVRADVQHYIDRIREVRGVPAEALEGYKNMILGSIENPPPGFDIASWTGRQVYIALGFVLLSAAMLGVDACPMEGIDAAKFDEILGLPKLGYNATVAVAAGYRAVDDSSASYKKVRFPEHEVIVRR